ncbi:Hypothetical protein IALB_1895 [Ignavibacterium album JCM 16511]|uniref:Uncharacterized protein n=1 Tax=Ignavibacterium album (strain DSM 19864 / JCM 16511 / NBRC 101810 / Mat9-16) TaxID=945713 RepID=I0AKU4_IGNAJ|nr:hypothetical protein [Ignavibacterium album]AFH49601.1 Hypothetical protein IALB_1895 [Ignavibacterium album JCM 16511]
MKEFPRKLSDAELNLLLLLLPEDKPGYSRYRNLIRNYFVIGEGRFGEGNYFLGKVDDEIDLEISSSPILTSGIVETDKTTFEISINQIQDDKIEFSISPYPDVNEFYRVKRVITISDWIPGKKSPDGNKVKLFPVDGLNYVLAIAPLDHKIWLYEKSSGINYPIPISNFYNELLRLKRESRNEVYKSPNKLFEEIESFTEAEIILAFLLYCKYKRRFHFDHLIDKYLTEPKNKKSLFSFFRRK